MHGLLFVLIALFGFIPLNGSLLQDKGKGNWHRNSTLFCLRTPANSVTLQSVVYGGIGHMCILCPYGEVSMSIKVYVINLAARLDRLHYITSELDRLGVSFERIPAVEASGPEVRALASRKPCRSGYVISDAGLACSLSHMTAWRKLLNSGESHCVVLEDDVVLSEDFATCLTPGWLPDGADVVRLETFKTRVHLAQNSVGSLGARGVYQMLSRHVGAAAYVISCAAAESLLEFMTPAHEAADEVMFNETYGWMPQANVFQVSPAMALQADNLDKEATAPTSVAIGSIDMRGIGKLPPGMETFGQRVSRRLRNELRARKLHSSYCVVPFER